VAEVALNQSNKGVNGDLTGLLAPRSVALVGATDHPTNFGGRVFRAMLKFGYKGKIFPVNPRLKEIYDLPCYPSVKDLPETPDHVGIIVATESVFDVLADCAARGVPFATVYTAGFSETGTPERRACASWGPTATASSISSTTSR